MNILDKSKKNKIIEKKIILKKNKKSLSQELFFKKQESPSKNLMSSKFLKKKFINYAHMYQEKNVKFIDYDKKEYNEPLNKIQIISGQKAFNQNKNKNKRINNSTRNNNLNTYKDYNIFNKKRNINYDNLTFNNPNLMCNNNNIQTPIKHHNIQYNNNNLYTQNKSSEITNTTTYNNSNFTKNSTTQYTYNNKNAYLDYNDELNPISILYKNHKNVNSCCNFNNNIERSLKKVYSVTNFNESPNFIKTNELFNHDNINVNISSENKTNNKKIMFDTCDIINDKKDALEFQKFNNYLDINSNGLSNNKTAFKEKKENDTSSFIKKGICLNLDKNSNYNNILYTARRSNNNYVNNKHIFIHKKRLSSFLINNQNNKNDENNEIKNNIINNKYVYKKVKKSFSCVNLKEKIKNERDNISKSKRKSKIININNNEEFKSTEKEIHNGGKIDLNLNKISNFKLFSEKYENKCLDFGTIYLNYLNSIIKIQKWFKSLYKLKKIKLIQKKLRKYWQDKNNRNKYFNNNVQIKPIINKCEMITKIYKYKNKSFYEKVCFIQKCFIEYLKNKNKVVKKRINNNCSISKIYKTKKYINKIILLQRKIKDFLQNGLYIHNRNVSNYFKYFNVNNMELSSSINQRYSNSKKYQKSIPISSRNRNRDLCNIESFNNSSYCNIANEYESNHKKIKSINKNDCINSLYLNYQMEQMKKLIKHKGKNNIININNKPKINNFQSYEIDYNLTNEKTHKLPKNSFSKIYKYSKYKKNNNPYERYNEEYSNNKNDNNVDNKDLSLNSIFSSLNNEKEYSNCTNNKNQNDKIIYLFLKEIFNKSIRNKIISNLLIIYRRFSLINYIMMIFQRISKNINQFVFLTLKDKSFKKFFIKDKININIFFNTIKRLILLNRAYMPKEIKILIDSIPKYTNNNINEAICFIPYIKLNIEHNLINNQLFNDNNNNDLSKFIQLFIKNEKRDFITQDIINKYMLKNKLYNRNIFTIVRYIDALYENSIKKNNNNIYDNKNKLKLNLLNEQKEPEYNFQEKIYIIKDNKVISDDISNNLSEENDCFSMSYENKYLECVNNSGRGILEQNFYNFWKDDDISVTNNNIINKCNEHVSLTHSKRNQQQRNININKIYGLIDYFNHN